MLLSVSSWLPGSTEASAIEGTPSTATGRREPSSASARRMPASSIVNAIFSSSPGRNATGRARDRSTGQGRTTRPEVTPGCVFMYSR